jgi:hypothetical protein
MHPSAPSLTRDLYASSEPDRLLMKYPYRAMEEAPCRMASQMRNRFFQVFFQPSSALPTEPSRQFGPHMVCWGCIRQPNLNKFYFREAGFHHQRILAAVSTTRHGTRTSSIAPQVMNHSSKERYSWAVTETSSMKSLSAEATFSAAAREAFADRGTARTLATKVLAARSASGTDSFVVSGRSYSTTKGANAPGSALSQSPKKK